MEWERVSLFLAFHPSASLYLLLFFFLPFPCALSLLLFSSLSLARWMFRVTSLLACLTRLQLSAGQWNNAEKEKEGEKRHPMGCYLVYPVFRVANFSLSRKLRKRIFISFSADFITFFAYRIYFQVGLIGVRKRKRKRVHLPLLG